MKIILLAGKHNSGKTTTLNLVYDQIAASMQNPPPKRKIRFASPTDFESSPLQYNGKTVAIYSLGDVKFRVDDAIRRYGNFSVGVLIIPCRTNFRWAQKLAASLQGSSQHCVIQKTLSSSTMTEVQANTVDCQQIISNI